MKVKQVTDTSFRKYGKILTGIDFSEIYNVLEEMDYPEDIEYAASFGPLEEPEFRQKLSNTLYGELSVEIGYCSGHNKMLNALEYHRSSEANVAVTDIILLLGQQSDITEDFTYDTAQLEAFFIPAGTAVELYATTLHYVPIGTKENDYAFKMGVVLQKQRKKNCQKKSYFLPRINGLSLMKKVGKKEPLSDLPERIFLWMIW